MFLLVIGIIAVIVGLIRGGSFKNLFKGELKAWWLFLIAILLFLGMQGIGIAGQMHLISSLTFWIQFAAYLILFIAIFLNLDKIWMYILLGGSLINFVVIFLNGGKMPVYETSLNIGALGGATGSYLTNFAATKVLAGSNTTLWFLGEVVPIPIPVVGEVLSVGTIIIAFTMFMIIQSAMIYTYVDEDEYNKLNDLKPALEGADTDTIAVGDLETMELDESGNNVATDMADTIVLSDLGDLSDEALEFESKEEIKPIEEKGDVLDELAEDPFDFTKSGEFEFGGDDIFANIEDDGTFDELSDDSYKGVSDELGEDFFTGLDNEETGASFEFDEAVETPVKSTEETIISDETTEQEASVLDDISIGEFNILEEDNIIDDIDTVSDKALEGISFDEPADDIMASSLNQVGEFDTLDELNRNEKSIMDHNILEDIPVEAVSEQFSFDDTAISDDKIEIPDFADIQSDDNFSAKRADIESKPINTETTMSYDDIPRDYTPQYSELSPSSDVLHGGSSVMNVGGAARDQTKRVVKAAADTAGANTGGILDSAIAGTVGSAATRNDALKTGAAFAAGAAVAGVAAAGFIPKTRGGSDNIHSQTEVPNDTTYSTHPTQSISDVEQPLKEQNSIFAPEQIDGAGKGTLEEYDFLSRFEDDDEEYSDIKLEDYKDPEDNGFVEYQEEPFFDDAEKDLDELELEDLVPTDEKIIDAKNILEEAEGKREQLKEQQAKVVERTSTAQTIDVDNPFVIVDGRIVENPYYKFKKEGIKQKANISKDIPKYEESRNRSLDSGVYVMEGGNLLKTESTHNSQEFIPQRNTDIEQIRLEEEELSLKLKEERLKRLEEERLNLEDSRPTVYTRSSADAYTEPEDKDRAIKDSQIQGHRNEIIPESEIMPTRSDVIAVGDDEENLYEKVEMKIGDVEIKFWKKDSSEE